MSTSPPASGAPDLRPERFRDYLRLIAEVELNTLMRRRVDPSDIVQDALLRAHQARDQFRGKTEESLLAWLRQIILNSITATHRDHLRMCRDIRRERPLGEAFDSSSRVIELAGSLSSPSHRLDRTELTLNLARAIVELPDDQRRVFLLRHWEDRDLPGIAEILERSLPSVAGLLRRATATVKEALGSRDSSEP